MSSFNNALNSNELLFNKKRKLEKGKEEENYTDLTIKNHLHKSQPLLRKRISDSEFNFNVPSSAINYPLTNSWEHLSNENELSSQYESNIFENENGKIVVNEPSDVPIVEEFEEKNEIYPFFNSHTLQYEFTPEGMIKDNMSNSYNSNSSYPYSTSTMGINNNNNGGIHRQESCLIPFKHDSQVILFNNNNTGQVVLYNKASKSLSIHKVRPNPKEIMSRNKRCILCNQLLPSERERMNANNIFKNSQTFTDAKYFRLLACSLSYTRQPSLTSASSNLNESNQSPIHSVNSAENIINLLNDNSKNGTEYINIHPAITIANSYTNNKNSSSSSNNKDEIREVDNIKEAKEEKEVKEDKNEFESNSTENDKATGNTTEGSSTYLSSSSFNNGYYERFFIERKKLGRGFRGSVFLCHHVLDQVFLGEYAIKKVAVGNNHQWLVRMLKEVMLLEKLRNPNIIEYKHAWLEEHTLSLFGPKVPCLFILMERANGGNLEEYVQLQWNPEEQLEKVLSVKERIKRKRLQMKAAQNQVKDNRAQFFGGIGYDSFGKRVRYLTTEAIWKIFLDICYGLNHLHELGIIHRDLKPPNLLLQYKDPNNQEEIPKVLISDFGECEILSHIEKRQRTGATGTLEFMAPELLISDETGHYYDDYSSNSDLWSLGVVLYYICFSEMPYSQVDDIDILKNEILSLTTVHFKNDNNSNRVPKELKTLIKKLMVKVPTERPKAKEILELYGGYKDGTSIKISSNINLSKNSFNKNSSSSSSLNNINSTESLNNLKNVENTILTGNNKIPNDNNYFSPHQNTNIPNKNSKKGKEKEEKIVDSNNEDKNENKNYPLKINKNDNNNDDIIIINNDNNDDNNDTIDTIDTKNNKSNKDNNTENEVEKDKEWLDKDLVDEPLSFKAEKRIVPFNHNRSKSLPFLPNVLIEKQYSNNKTKNNKIIQSAIEEENNFFSDKENFKKNSSNDIDTYQSEKSLIPFHSYRQFNRSLPSPIYPPTKDNEKEQIPGIETKAIKKYDNTNNNEDWIYEKEYTKKTY